MNQIPAALKALTNYPQFILWKAVQNVDTGKIDKIPVDHVTLHPSNAHNPAVWLPAPEALERAAAVGAPYGVGFVFTPSDPFYFLDIDGALTTDASGAPAWSSLATGLLRALPGAAVEVSQSGRGLHVFGTYTARPDHGCKNIAHGLELYTEARFVALTGTQATGDAGTDSTAHLEPVVGTYFPPSSGGAAPVWSTEPIPEWNGYADDQDLISHALAAASGASVFSGRATFADLWHADPDALARSYPDDTSGREYDSSSADAALAQHLAFWTGNDCARIDRLMRLSALRREKWEGRPDYLPRTISRAVAKQSTVYTAGGGTVPGAPSPPDPNNPVATTTPLRATGETTALSGIQYLAATQQTEYFAGCVYVQNSHRIFTPDGSMLKPDQFKATYGGFVFALDTSNDKTTRNAWEVFTESQAVRHPKVHGGIFRPSMAPGEILTEYNRHYVNTYVPMIGPRSAGDAAPFLRHVELLVPDPGDREILLSYMAACVQLIGTKAQWCPVIQGVPGNGKTVLYHVLEQAIGPEYCHLLDPKDLDSKFNSWIERRLLVGVEEIRTAGRQDIADTLKPLITNMRVPVQAKGQDQRTGDNCANFMMNSNYKDAVLKTVTDRRYCVFYTAQQTIEDLIRDGMTGGYFAKLFGWLHSGGYAIVAQYLATREITVDIQGRAPQTTSTSEALRSSLGTAEQMVIDAVDLRLAGFGSVLCTQQVKAYLSGEGKRLGPQKITALLETIGYIRHPYLEGNNGRLTLDGIRRRLYVKAGTIEAAMRSKDLIAAAWKKQQVAPAVSAGSAVFGGGQ